MRRENAGTMANGTSQTMSDSRSPRDKSDDSDIEEIEFVEKAESVNDNNQGEIPIVEEIRVHFDDRFDSGSPREDVVNSRTHGQPSVSNQQNKQHDSGDHGVSCATSGSTEGDVAKTDRNNQTDEVSSSTKIVKVDFVARNKSMVAENSGKLRMQKSKRRAMTAVPKKRPNKSKPVDNDPRTRNIVRSVKVSSFCESVSDSMVNPTKQDRHASIIPDEWTILSENQLRSFRKLFSKFDQTQNGGISAKELFESVKKLLPDDEIPFEDVQKVHAELDIKQTGEIEFDEFIFALTHPKNYVKLINDDDRMKLTKEIKIWENFQLNSIDQPTLESGQTRNSMNKNIFFTMVRNVAKKDSMKEIRRFYVNKIKKMNDHVIQDWAAGQRVIGLSNEGVVRRFNDITSELNKSRSKYAKQKNYKDSPYAQPLHYGLVHLKLNSSTNEKSQKSPRIPKILRNVDSDILRAELENEATGRRVKSAGVRTQPGNHPSTESYTPKAKRKSIPYHTSNVMPDRRSMVRRSTVRRPRHIRAKSAPQPEFESVFHDHHHGTKRLHGVRSAPLGAFKSAENAVAPKTVPLPVYPVKKGQTHFDYDSVEKIRRRASGILQEYYNRLRKASTINSKEIFKKLQVDQISDVQLKQFKRCYSAYLGGCESFVISPWVPIKEPSPTWASPLGEPCVKTAWA